MTRYAKFVHDKQIDKVNIMCLLGVICFEHIHSIFTVSNVQLLLYQCLEIVVCVFVDGALKEYIALNQFQLFLTDCVFRFCFSMNILFY